MRCSTIDIHFKAFAANGDRRGSYRSAASPIEIFRSLARVQKVTVPSGILVQGTIDTAHASMREGVLPEVAEEYKARGYEARATTKEEAQAIGQNGWNGLGVSLVLKRDGSLSVVYARQQEAELYKNFSLDGYKLAQFNKDELRAHSPRIGGVGINLVVEINGEKYIFGGRKPESFIGEKQWHPSSGPMNFDEKAIQSGNKDLREMVLHTANVAALRGTNDLFERLLTIQEQAWSDILDKNAFYMSDAVTGTAAIVLQVNATQEELLRAINESSYDSAATPLTGVKVSDLSQLTLKTGDKCEEVFSLPSGINIIELSSQGVQVLTVSDDFVVRPAALPYEKILQVK